MSVFGFIVVNMVVKDEIVLIAILFGQAFFNSDTKLVFVHASVIFSGKTLYTYSLELFVVGFHFLFLTVVKAWLCVNSYKTVQLTAG